ncbi:MAG: S8 family serine peptidase [bacterium]
MPKLSKLTIIFFFLIIVGLFYVVRYSRTEAQTNSALEQFSTVATSKANADNFAFVADEFIVTFKNPQVLSNSATVMLRTQMTESQISGNIYAIKIQKNVNSKTFVKKTRIDSNIKTIDPNYLRFLDYIPNDPAFMNNGGNKAPDMWGWLANYTNVVGAWDITNQKTLKPVIVADIDDGATYTTVELKNMLWDGSNCNDNNGNPIVGGCIHGYDFVKNSNDPKAAETKDGQHGTAVSSVIAAERDNKLGVAGVAPNAKMMIIKITDNAFIDSATAIKGFYFAYYNGAQIINASFGGLNASQEEINIISKINDKGIILVSAAGNRGLNNDEGSVFPCNFKYSNSICVGATTSSDRLHGRSNYGAIKVEIGAPGDQILLPYVVNGSLNYGKWDGTSFASPFVAGEAALIWGYNPALTATQVKDIILTTGDDIDHTNKQTMTNKRVNVYKAILKAQTLLPPTVIPTNTVMPTNTNVPVTITSTAVPTNTLVPTITPTIDPNAPAFYKVIPPATNLGKNIKDLCVTKGAGWYLTDQCKYLASSISYWCIGCEPGSTGGKELDLVIPTTATNMDICCVKEVTITNIPTITVTPHTTITNTPGITVTIVVPSIPPDAVNCGPVDIFNKEGRTPGDQYIDIYDFIAFKGMYGKYCNDNPNIYSPCGSKNLVRSSTATLNKIDILDLQKFADIYHKSYCGNVETINSLPQTGGGTVAEELLKYFTLIVLEVIAGGVIVYQGHRLKRRGWRSASRAEGSK